MHTAHVVYEWTHPAAASLSLSLSLHLFSLSVHTSHVYLVERFGDLFCARLGVGIWRQVWRVMDSGSGGVGILCMRVWGLGSGNSVHG